MAPAPVVATLKALFSSPTVQRALVDVASIVTVGIASIMASRRVKDVKEKDLEEVDYENVIRSLADGKPITPHPTKVSVKKKGKPKEKKDEKLYEAIKQLVESNGGVMMGKKEFRNMIDF